MMMKSKYGPGGEFDPEWFVFLFSSPLSIAYSRYRKPPMATGPQPPGPPPPPPDAPPPPEEMPIPRPAWRTVPQRSTRRSRKRQDPVPPPPPPEPRQVHSWVTWQRKFGLVWDPYSESVTDIFIA